MLAIYLLLVQIQLEPPMPLTPEQIDNVVQLFQHEDFSSTLQGVELVETIINNETDFRLFLQVICEREIPAIPRLKNLKKSLNRFKRSTGSYVAIWALSTLAQWNPMVRQKTTKISLWTY